MSTAKPYGYFSARAAWGCMGARTEHTCSVCGKAFMMDVSCHVYRVRDDAQCSYSCYRQAQQRAEKTRRRRGRAGGVPPASRETCVRRIAQETAALEGAHGMERERISARLNYWRYKLAAIDRERADSEATMREE